MSRRESFVCCDCGFRGMAEPNRAYCKCRPACRRRQSANARLIGRFEGSIRYSGETFDRVERLKALRLAVNPTHAKESA